MLIHPFNIYWVDLGSDLGGGVWGAGVEIGGGMCPLAMVWSTWRIRYSRRHLPGLKSGGGASRGWRMVPIGLAMPLPAISGALP